MPCLQGDGELSHELSMGYAECRQECQEHPFARGFHCEHCLQKYFQTFVKTKPITDPDCGQFTNLSGKAWENNYKRSGKIFPFSQTWPTVPNKSTAEQSR